MCVCVCVCVDTHTHTLMWLFCGCFFFSSISTRRLLGGSTGEARDVGQIDPFGEGRFWLSAFQQDLNQEDSH